jgi:hypothetical protein
MRGEIGKIFRKKSTQQGCCLPNENAQPRTSGTLSDGEPDDRRGPVRAPQVLICEVVDCARDYTRALS